MSTEKCPDFNVDYAGWKEWMKKEIRAYLDWKLEREKAENNS